MTNAELLRSRMSQKAHVRFWSRVRRGNLPGLDNELVKAISGKSGSIIKDAEKFLDSFVETITEVMKKGDDVTLVGFGTFSVANRAERIGRNFKTGKNIQIPASKSVKFKVGKTLKDAVK